MKQRCANCQRVLPIGQLRKEGGEFVCIKMVACERAKQRLQPVEQPAEPVSPPEDEIAA